MSKISVVVPELIASLKVPPFFGVAAITDDEIEDGYILTCQSRPISNEVEVNYDEV